MACNVFGNPITNATLEGMPEYIGKKIGREDRAHVAMYKKNDGEKDVNARKHVDNLKLQYSYGVSSLCLVYNATGDTLTYVTCIDWYGHIGTSPYLVQIANGQWGVFLHVKTAGQATGSVAAVVYRGKNAGGSICDWMLAWRSPWNPHLFTNTKIEEYNLRRFGVPAGLLLDCPVKKKKRIPQLGYEKNGPVPFWSLHSFALVSRAVEARPGHHHFKTDILIHYRHPKAYRGLVTSFTILEVFREFRFGFEFDVLDSLCLFVAKYTTKVAQLLVVESGKGSHVIAVSEAYRITIGAAKYPNNDMDAWACNLRKSMENLVLD